CGDLGHGVPTNGDIEDLFDVDDYLWLFNKAFNTNLSASDLPATGEPIIKRIGDIGGEFDHALPAHALTDNRQEFFTRIRSASDERFVALFEALNATLTEI